MNIFDLIYIYIYREHIPYFCFSVQDCAMAAFAKSDKCIRPGQGLADSFGVHDMQYIYIYT